MEQAEEPRAPGARAPGTVSPGTTSPGTVSPETAASGQPGATNAGAGAPERPVARATRTSRTWIGIAVGTLALIVILIFCLQNRQSVHVSFFSASGSAPLALALLLAAVLGALAVLLVGSVRIVQLRRQVRRGGRPRRT